MTDLRRLARDAGRIAVRSSELPAATMLTLAHRLPILWASSPSAWQQAELWRMTLEKPLVLGRVWAALALSPLQVWLALARAWGPRGGAALPFELAALGTAAHGRRHRHGPQAGHPQCPQAVAPARAAQGDPPPLIIRAAGDRLAGSIAMRPREELSVVRCSCRRHSVFLRKGNR